MKKFELVTDMSISFLGRKLFRIRALVDFATKWGDAKGYPVTIEVVMSDGETVRYRKA